MDMADRTDPTSEYAAGVRDLAEEAGLCGAYNPETPAGRYVVCIRNGSRGALPWHTGMHDDGWRHFGDRDATSAENQADSHRHRRDVTAPASGLR